jgi:hypothetical protein
MLSAMPRARRPFRWRIGLLIFLVAGSALPAGAIEEGAKATGSEYVTPRLRDPAGLRRRLEAARRSEADEQAALTAGRDPDPKAHVEYPRPPAIDLRLTVENRSKKFVRLWNLGDDRGPFTIVLRGEGAVTVSPRRLRTMVLRKPRPLVLAPGTKHVIHLDRLAFGFRGDDRAYWTSSGQYQISVEWHTALAPSTTTRPHDDPFHDDPFGDTGQWRTTTLTSNPVTVTVRSP